MMVLTIIIVGAAFFLYGLYFGYKLGKTSRKIELPGWVQTIRDVFGL